MRWVTTALASSLFQTVKRRKRLLVIYDTSSQPFSIGDVIVVQEASLVLLERHQLEAVDCAFVYDARRPAPPDPAFASITGDNVFYHLSSLLPVAQVNQHLGSLFVFDSHRKLERFIADNESVYQVWPTAWKYATQEYLNYTVFNDLLYEHYNEHRRIPHLTCRKHLVGFADAFFSEHVSPLVPVTVNIRKNASFQSHRNVRIEAWLEFFRYCDQRYPAKFVVICAWSEVDDRLRDLPNVIIAKDHHTGVEEDLALIQASAMHMGTSSGPAALALFNDSPYLIVNTDFSPEYFARPEMIVPVKDDVVRFWFAGPMQRCTKGVETTEVLIREFAELWSSVELGGWRKPEYSAAKPMSGERSWLR